MNKLIALVLVSACGRGDGTGFVVDAGSVHTLDAPGPPTRVCGVGASLGGLILGNAEMPVPGELALRADLRSECG